MKTLEDILFDYCGSFGPVVNDKTGKFTSFGIESYKHLKGFISSLGNLGVLSSNDVIKELDKIARPYMSNRVSNSTNLNATKILKLTRGKKLHTYDSWGGSSMTIVVEDIELLSNSVLFSGTNYWGGESSIYVDFKYLDELLNRGSASKHNTIERCDVVTSWTIK